MWKDCLMATPIIEQSTAAATCSAVTPSINGCDYSQYTFQHGRYTATLTTTPLLSETFFFHPPSRHFAVAVQETNFIYDYSISLHGLKSHMDKPEILQCFSCCNIPNCVLWKRFVLTPWQINGKTIMDFLFVDMLLWNLRQCAGVSVSEALVQVLGARKHVWAIQTNEHHFELLQRNFYKMG